MPNSWNWPKVADWIFGDDAGFLSWLWIAAEEKKKSIQESAVAWNQSTENNDLPVNDEKPHVEKEIKPQMKEARVIKKAQPKPPVPAPKKSPKKESSVDDFINKKREEASYDSSFRQKKSSSWKARPTFIKENRKPRTAVTLWRTNRQTAKSTEKQQPTHKKEKVYKVSDSLKKKTTIVIAENIVVKEFSEKMWVPLPEVIKVLLANKILVAAQASIDFDTATLIAAEFDVTVEKESTQTNITDILEWNLQWILDQDKESTDLTTRPPIVTIMWHVDHGKTKLLDYLRKTDMVGWEVWWITQSIGASQIIHNEQKITFIDTPWHELFTSLRARGSKITNIVIVVVAADDWVKPQTVEAIHHAQDAWVPIIVAITKIDLWVWKIEEIKWQLAQYGLQPEDRWWDIMIVPCSSMTWQWIDDLLDAVLLQYEMLELQYSPSRNAVWVVVEAHKDAKQWVTTSLLIMTWTLRVWDRIVIHNSSWKVRRMTDWTWRPLKEATWWDPVMILGIQDLPEPWRVAEVVSSEKEAIKKISAIKDHEQTLSKEAVLQSLFDKIGQWDAVDLKLILKADSFGSLEAIKHAAAQVTLPENIELKIIHADVWSISDWDVTFAQAAWAIIVWFNVWASGTLKKKAEQLNITIKEYDIIYQFIDYLEQLGQWMVEQEEIEVRIWKLSVLAVFFKRWKEMIFGWKVIEWVAKNGVKIKVFRGEELVKTEEEDRVPEIIGTVTSLQKEQESVSEIAIGHECGIKARMSKKLEEGDIVEFWETQIK